jgi:multidrug efflux pump subunit AcrB
MFRVNGEPAIGLAISMREGGDILALGKNIDAAIAKATADLPLGITPHLVADQSVTVRSAISEFMESLWQTVAIILAVSFIALGVRPGLVVALAIPLTLAIVFAAMDLAHIDMQRISLGALIIALALLVDDAMTTIDATMNRLAAGDSKIEAAAFAFRTYAVAMLAGALVTIAGLIPVGFAAVVDASSSRFRPIMLTAVSTVLGLIPIATTVFWGPMAFAIMGGLLVGTLLTLIFLPTLYATWFGGREKAT